MNHVAPIYFVVCLATVCLVAGCATTKDAMNATGQQGQQSHTLADLLAKAKMDPLTRPDFEATPVEEMPIEAQDVGFLVGKWFCRKRMYLKHWWTDGKEMGVRSDRINGEDSWEFNRDGTFSLKQRFRLSLDKPWQNAESSGRWTYSADNGNLVLYYDNGQPNNAGYECRVVWFSENKIAIRGRGECFDTEEALASRAHTEKQSMQMKRDKYGWIATSHESHKGDIATYSQMLQAPEYLNRISPPPTITKPSLTVVALKYDPMQRCGVMSVKVECGKYEETRKWIRKNIETLARDKNIALTTGEIPPAAKFYLGREELKDGNVLEIEFKTE